MATSVLIMTLAATVLVGLSLGLFGGGGSILMVPLLSYMAKMPAHESIATSLLVVGATSAATLVPHAFKKNVRFGPGVALAAASMIGAYAGGMLAKGIPAAVLMTGFAGIMIASALGMIRGRKQPARTLPGLLVLPIGLGIGLLTGLLGAGGGFLIVPALVLLAGLPMGQAVGTSLLVIALNSVAGVAGQAASAAVNVPLSAGLVAAAILGSLAGARLAHRINEKALRRSFGWFVLAMGVFVLTQELPAPAGIAVLAVAGAASLLGTSCLVMPNCRLALRAARS